MIDGDMMAVTGPAVIKSATGEGVTPAAWVAHACTPRGAKHNMRVDQSMEMRR
jgi:hypothetical protein